MSKKRTKGIPAFPGIRKNFKRGAINLHKQGFTVIPIKSGSKKPATTWDEWEDNPTEEKISAYWDKYPNHEVGIITNSQLTVFDADSERSKAALYLLEETVDIQPNYIVKTKKGEHHYFSRPEGVYAKQDSFDSAKHPDRIDIKTDRSLVIAPPSGNKEVLLSEFEHVDDLASVDQDFVDAVFKHNGRESPRPFVKKGRPKESLSDLIGKTDEISLLLGFVDSDCGYNDWTKVGMALHHEYQGSDDGLDIFDRWSSGGRKYKGREEVERKWQSFAGYSGMPITIGTIRKMASDNGADLIDIQMQLEPEFEALDGETEVVYPEAVMKPDLEVNANTKGHPLLKYSIKGQSQQLLDQMAGDVFVLAGIALSGQWTVIFAPTQTGKTLLILYLLINAIRAGEVDGNNVFYINADDNLNGIAYKLKLAEEHGFHMLAPGHKGFRADYLEDIIRELCSSAQAQDTIIFLDTAKKFGDPMNKSAARKFGIIMREFSARGGTVIVLAHTNKNLGPDGMPVYAGTSDAQQDPDCTYMMRVVDEDTRSNTKVIEFRNEKDRGNVVKRVSYQYSTREGLTYQELLDSVEQVDDDEALLLGDSDLKQEIVQVDAIIGCIEEGINTKMKLGQAVARATGASNRSVLKLIEKYTGDDPAIHKWSFKRGERGAKVFSILRSSNDTDEDPENLQN